jgi:hypothetical protein
MNDFVIALIIKLNELIVHVYRIETKAYINATDITRQFIAAEYRNGNPLELV